MRCIVFGASGDRVGRRRGGHQEVELLASYGDRAGYSADLLYGGFCEGNVVTGALAVETPGRMALLFTPPGGGLKRYASTTTLILEAIRVEACNRDLVLLQALVDPADASQAALLAGAGYWRLATLLYCRRLVQAAPPTGGVRPGLEFVAYPQAGEGEFRMALAATYEGSLDCPGLAGLRSLDDIIDGHRATGSHDPNLWYVARNERNNLGVLLLSPVPGRSCVEVVYMGVAPAYRGRGVASACLAHARNVCRQRGFDELILAVDGANLPARALYDRWGFQIMAQRTAWILVLQGRFSAEGDD